MPRSTATLVSVTRITDLLDRLDPTAHARCTVPGCIHDDAPARVGRGRSRPPRSPERREVTPQAA
jgi:hypothetical protein